MSTGTLSFYRFPSDANASDTEPHISLHQRLRLSRREGVSGCREREKEETLVASSSVVDELSSAYESATSTTGSEIEKQNV